MVILTAFRAGTAYHEVREVARVKFLSRVVWSEGMYPGPHHFQLISRYFEDSIRFAASELWFEPSRLPAE